jgi:hypothetical protein
LNRELKYFINFTIVVWLVLIGVLVCTGQAWALDLRGFVEGEARLFVNEPIHPGQDDHQFSLKFSPEWSHKLEDGTQFYFIPFFRLDSADNERTHFDLRELDVIIPRDDWELRIGVRKVFWGVTETFHLVDIVNQTDLVESIDLEEKLGQPMVNLSIPTDFGIFDFYVLPFFRERTFTGRGGRFRPSILVDTDQTRYESAAEEWHTDFAVRYFNAIGKLDLGLSYFIGTNREPVFEIGTKGSEIVLIPVYEGISQWGLDALYVLGSWIFKVEALYRKEMRPEDYLATVSGFEYTFSGAFGTGMDLGVLAEWMYDERQELTPHPFQNDLTAGMRLVINDVEGTEILAAVVQDLEARTRLYFVEISSRLTEHWRLTAEYRGFTEQPSDDLSIDFRDDDFFQLSLAYHF